MKQQKEHKVNNLFNKLKDGVEMFYDSETWKQFLKVQARFHDYSFRNTVLIFLQCPHATRVAGYTDWQKLGRYPKRGESSIKIIAPHFIKVRNEETGEDERVLNGYHQASVFDVSQTDGKPIPELIQELTMDTECIRDFYEKIKAACPFPIEEVSLNGGVKGTYNRESDVIQVKKDMAALQKTKTLVHEWSHACLHKVTDKERDLKEVEAEGTAYVVLSYFGFDTSEYSFNYVAGWNGSIDGTAIQEAGATIQKTACKIIDMIQEKLKTE